MQQPVTQIILEKWSIKSPNTNIKLYTVIYSDIPPEQGREWPEMDNKHIVWTSKNRTDILLNKTYTKIW